MLIAHFKKREIMRKTWMPSNNGMVGTSIPWTTPRPLKRMSYSYMYLSRRMYYPNLS